MEWASAKVASLSFAFKVDVCAKRWEPATDTFEYRRFTDCTRSSNAWQGVPQGWYATHYMRVPDLQKET